MRSSKQALVLCRIGLESVRVYQATQSVGSIFSGKRIGLVSELLRLEAKGLEALMVSSFLLISLNTLSPLLCLEVSFSIKDS